MLDVRAMVREHTSHGTQILTGKTFSGATRGSLNLESQLKVLGLTAFEGRQHSGIDDARNIARIVTELARRSVRLQPNIIINPNRRWQWMGKSGEVLDEYVDAPS